MFGTKIIIKDKSVFNDFLQDQKNLAKLEDSENPCEIHEMLISEKNNAVCFRYGARRAVFFRLDSLKRAIKGYEDFMDKKNDRKKRR
jgi:hypothetical protein